MARTFRATISVSDKGEAKVPLASEIVEELGPRPGENLKASMRGTEFTGRVAGSLRAPGLLIPEDVVRALGLREGQGVRLTVIGRAS
ncbi:MAG: hypothetical protein ABR548_01430 [Actinomycetota bacterium]|nr:hypothetical protein [Actinomycetota bacterium]